MRLAELPVGTGILFDVSIQKQELEFPSEVVEVHDNFTLYKTLPLVFTTEHPTPFHTIGALSFLE